jgi:putative mRNA 3-end processing factor
MPVELRRGGLHLTGTPLWLDAKKQSELSFVSHAHADHIARHERVIATQATLNLMTHRLGPMRAALPVPYARPFDLGPLSIELLPAGHILGSAQIRVTREDGHRVVYTGDLNPAGSLTAEPATVAECDTLVIESTFAHPHYRFPPREKVFIAIESWVRSQLDRGVHPILLAYPLGKSQELIKYLGDRGFALCAQAKTYEVTKLYEQMGTALAPVRRFDGKLRAGEVGLFPPGPKHAAALSKIGPHATAVVTGWAVDSFAVRRYGADYAFALSDHGDFDAMMKYALATRADEIVTTHGFAREFAEALRAKGKIARAVGVPLQLSLF